MMRFARNQPPLRRDPRSFMDINDIARRAGVSRATVSRYLNDGYVSQEKRQLISSIIEETGYVPSQNAQQLRTGKTRLVGVIIPKINSQSVSRMVAGITDTLAQSNYHVVLANTNNDERLEVDYLNLFCGRHHVDGVILIGLFLKSDLIENTADLLGILSVHLTTECGHMIAQPSSEFHALFRYKLPGPVDKIKLSFRLVLRHRFLKISHIISPL